MIPGRFWNIGYLRISRFSLDVAITNHDLCFLLPSFECFRVVHTLFPRYKILRFGSKYNDHVLRFENVQPAHYPSIWHCVSFSISSAYRGRVIWVFLRKDNVQVVTTLVSELNCISNISLFACLMLCYTEARIDLAAVVIFYMRTYQDIFLSSVTVISATDLVFKEGIGQVGNISSFLTSAPPNFQTCLSVCISGWLSVDILLHGISSRTLWAANLYSLWFQLFMHTFLFLLNQYI